MYIPEIADCSCILIFLFGVMHNFELIYFQESLSMQGLLFLTLHLNSIHIPTDAKEKYPNSRCLYWEIDAHVVKWLIYIFPI